MKTKSNIIIRIMITTLMMSGITTSAFAGGLRFDFDERYEDVPRAPECWTDSFDDGANDSFDEDRGEECKDRRSVYSWI